MAFSAFPSSTTRQSRMFVGLVVCTIISLTFLILQYGIFGSGNFSAKYTPPLSSLSSSLAPSSSIQSSGSMRGSKGREIGNRDASTCEWKSGDPVLLQIRNMNHVHYDAGHWFHMSENIMVQVSSDFFPVFFLNQILLTSQPTFPHTHPKALKATTEKFVSR